jgi:murein DD-endopeptidase MepM/ murein hydrolase activator NlpD
VAGLPEPIYSMYGHIETALRVGDRVTRRQQIGVIGDPVTFGPHLHFEIKNHTAFVNPPFSGCSDLPQQRYVSAGYSGKQNDYSGGDAWDPSNDGVAANLYYHPTRFVQARLSGGVAALKAEALQATVPREDDGLPRCTHQE